MSVIFISLIQTKSDLCIPKTLLTLRFSFKPHMESYFWLPSYTPLSFYCDSVSSFCLHLNYTNICRGHKNLTRGHRLVTIRLNWTSLKFVLTSIITINISW